MLTRELHAPPVARAERASFAWSPMAFGLAGYLCFGLGYIGYMTFIVTLLREQGLAGAAISAFYILLGAAVIASSWLWAGLLQRWRGGGVLALLNALLAVATLLPVVSRSTPAAFASGLLFGAVFLQVVAATTALVRHNLPAAAWPAGITAFTIIFAAGQIVGPTVVGYVADSAGGLLRGLALSAGVLALGAVLASLQRPLVPQAGPPMTTTRRLLLLSVSAGAGHVRAAQALEAAALARGDIEVTHLDVLTLVPAWFRKAYGEWYLDLVERHPNLWAHLYQKSDRTPADAWEHKLRRAVERVSTRELGTALREAQPDAVICTHFLPAELLARATLRGKRAAATVGAGHRLRLAPPVGAARRRRLLRGQRRDCISPA